MISELPEFLLQHILSFLPTKDAARTSLLSKTWLRAWSTRSILVFYQTNEVKRFKSKPFHQVVNETLTRYQQQSLCIQKLSLYIDPKCCMTKSLLDEWLGIALTNNVLELDLGIFSVYNTDYILRPVFTTTSRLTALTLDGLRLVLTDTVSLRCPNLTTLILKCVSLGDQTFQNLASSFPLLEVLHLTDCTDLKKVRVANLFSLKIFRCHLTCEVKEVFIEAPKLQYFTCGNFGRATYGSFSLSIEPSHTLRFLTFHLTAITDTQLDTLLSQCPMLEDLSLEYCYKLQIINISSRSLKCFSLRECQWLVEAKIDAPNLCSLSLESRMFEIPNLSFVTRPAKLANSKATIVTRTYLPDIDLTWFRKLGSLATKFKEFDFSLEAIWGYKNTLKRKDFIAVPLPPDHELQELKLQMYLSVSLPYPVAISGLFSTCHPKTVLVSWDTSQAKLIKCLCKELLRKRNLNCCDRDPVNCWWNYLEDAKLEIFSVTPGEWIHLHRKRFLASLTNLERGTEIRFSLKWCVAEELLDAGLGRFN